MRIPQNLSRTIWAALMFTSMSAALLGAATHSIDISPVDQQTVDYYGFAVFHEPYWGPEFTITDAPAAMDALFRDMGANLLRVSLGGDPFDKSGINPSSLTVHQKELILEAQARGMDYYLSLWTPPADMKTNNSKSGGGDDGHLRSDCEDIFVQRLSECVTWLMENDCAAPKALSFQNEPGWGPWYDGCVYDAAQYRRVAKKLRAYMDAHGLADIPLHCCDGATEDDTMDKLGLSPDRTGVMDTDQEFNRAVGVISVHTYDLHNGLYSWGKDRLQKFHDAVVDRPQKVWMTEWEMVTYASGIHEWTNAHDNWDLLHGTIRHYNRDMSMLRFSNWSYWGSCYVSEPPESGLNMAWLTGKQSPTFSPAYYLLKKIWTNARPPCVVRRVTSTDPDFKGASFDNFWQDFSCFVSNGRMVLVVVNINESSKTLDICGMEGDNATVYRYTRADADRKNTDMTLAQTHPVTGGTITDITFPPQSISVLVSESSVGVRTGAAGERCSSGGSAQGPAQRSTSPRWSGADARYRAVTVDGRTLRPTASWATGSRPASGVAVVGASGSSGERSLRLIVREPASR